MQNNQYPRLVSWSYVGAFSMLGKNDKEVLTEIYITDPKGEELLKRGILPSLNWNSCRAPYFKVTKTEGYTRRAKKYGELKLKMSREYPELENKLKGTTSKLLDWGDYIHIELAYINNYKNPIVDTKNGWYNEEYIEKAKFNVEFIKKLIDYTPYSLMGGAINDYKEKVLPEFMRNLQLFNQDLYDEATKGTGWENQTISYIGHKAKLSTLSNGVVIFRADYSIGDKEFYWDGQLLKQVKETRDGTEIYIKPTKDTVVKIADNNTVNEDTAFLN